MKSLKKNMNYPEIANLIIDYLGGRSNIISFNNCITRLRFQIRNLELIQKEKIKELSYVIGIVNTNNNDYQIILNNKVEIFGKEIKKILTIGAKVDKFTTPSSTRSKSILGRWMTLIIDLFQPIIYALIATGIIQGIAAILLAANVANDNGTYLVLNALGKSFFYFLPFFLAYTASKRFGLNIFIGFVLAGTILMPELFIKQLQNNQPIKILFANTWFESKVYFHFIGIPIINTEYYNTILPIIFVIYFASKISKLISRFSLKILRNFLVPVLTLLIVVPLTLIIIGPFANMISQVIGRIIWHIYLWSPIAVGIILGFGFTILQVFGLHWGIIFLIISNFSQPPFQDPIVGIIFVLYFTQIGAILATLIIERKNKELKTIAIPAIISCLLGITEPAIYSINLPRKKPFIASCVAGAILGGVAGYIQLIALNFTGLGVFQFSGFINNETQDYQKLYYALAIAGSGIILTFILTGIFHFFKMPKKISLFYQKYQHKWNFICVWVQQYKKWKLKLKKKIYWKYFLTKQKIINILFKHCKKNDKK